VFAAVLATLLFSGSAITAAKTAALMGGTEANFWRLALAAALLTLYANTVGGGAEGGVYHLFALSGILGFGLGDVAFFQALPRLGTRLSVLFVNTMAAPIAAATEWVWLGTSLRPAEAVSAGVILAGVAIALAPGEHTHIGPRRFWPGLFAGLLAACGQAWGAVLSRKAFALASASGAHIDGATASYQRIVAGVAVAGLCLLVVKWRWVFAHGRNIVASPVEEPDMPDSREKWRRAWPWIVMNTLAGPTAGVSCFQWALKTTPTGVVLPIIALVPLVVIPFTMRFEGEKPTPRSLVGGLVAVAGTVALALA
jgi:drug/metabolite transporter (DMT)-like permease